MQALGAITSQNRLEEQPLSEPRFSPGFLPVVGSLHFLRWRHWLSPFVDSLGPRPAE